MKPIIFNTEMVRAILDGRKTQTRRMLKPQPVDLPAGAYIDPYNHNYEHFTAWTADDKMCNGQKGNVKNTCHWKPDYLPGDVLYVRETWAKVYQDEPPHDMKESPFVIEYKADTNDKYPGGWPDEMSDDPDCGRWKPSIHMPKEYARLFLRVTDVRVQRVQDINGQGHHDDVLKEGWPFVGINTDNPKDDFAHLWDSMYHNWDENPWVWVYTFERVETPA